MRTQTLFDLHEPTGLGIEPMKIPIEDHGRGGSLRGSERIECIERGKIAVEPADHVEHFGRQIRRTVEAGRIVTVVLRMDTPRSGHYEATAAFKAPPQLEP